MSVRKSDVIWNYIGIIMALGSNFIVLPMLIKYLNSDILGIWYIYLSIGAIVNLFNFGFNPTLARNVAYCWGGAKSICKENVEYSDSNEPNFNLLKKVLVTTKRIYLIIASVALLVLLVIATPYIIYISSGIDTNIHYIAWCFYAIATVFNLYFGYYFTYLRGVGAVKEANIVRVVTKFIQIIITIILLILKFNIIAPAIGILVVSILSPIYCKYYFYKFNNIGFHLKKISNKFDNNDIKNIFNNMWHNAWRDGFVSLSNYLSNQATVFVASFFLPLSQIGIYSIAVQLVTAVVQISGSLYTTYQPSMQIAYVSRDKKKLITLMSESVVVFFLLFIIGILGLIFIAIPILKIVNLNFSLDIVLVILLSAYNLLLKHHQLYASYISNTNSVPYVKAFIISSSLGIALSVVFLSVIHPDYYYLVLGPIIVQLCYNNWYWPYIIHKDWGIGIFKSFDIGLRSILKKIRNLIKLEIKTKI